MDAATAELISHPLFSVLSEAARRELSAAAVRRRVRRGEIIYAPDTPADTIFLIRRGCIKVSRLSTDGREVTLCLRSDGELFGEDALVEGVARACQAQTLEESTLFSLPAPLLQRLMNEEATLAVGLAGLVCQRREQTEDQVEDFAFRDVGGRLARFLMTLAAHQGVKMDDGRTVLRIRLTHQELANCVGTTRETLTLTIDRFKSDGWIQFEGRMIAICDPEALRTRAGDSRVPGNQ